ncbi:DUF7671 family protein [Furfurilactobacillus curtus]|uniref:DUF7671 domain-containing protein n=1 Tax=Furfurilactobacillus curtus TaxID=1746200 RepID=A0ABQ5JNP5_9LACO
MKAKYEVTRYTGVPVTTDSAGHYVVTTGSKLHDWRTGKHTRGHFNQLGQLFLTENNLLIAVLATQPVAFKDRHQWTPMQRFTSETLSNEMVVKLRQQFHLDET